MKGYSPNLIINKKAEINSKVSHSFIELGVKLPKCKENCECEVCKSK